MTLRAKSKARQWLLWLGAALAAVTVYVVLARLQCGSASLNLLDPSRYRLVLPIIVLFALFAWETRWDGVVRKKTEGRRLRSDGHEKTAAEDQDRNEDRVTASGVCTSSSDGRSEPTVDGEGSVSRKAQPTRTRKSGPAPGESLYAQARLIPHQEIPDLKLDNEYLSMLNQSAREGYPRAMAKLGDYAMRRCAWIEAYYWMWRAQRGGMRDLSPVLLEIRHNWAISGHPEQRSNVNELFTEEWGEIGRALLGVDSGRNAAVAREYLRAHFPEGVNRL